MKRALIPIVAIGLLAPAGSAYQLGVGDLLGGQDEARTSADDPPRPIPARKNRVRSGVQDGRHAVLLDGFGTAGGERATPARSWEACAALLRAFDGGPADQEPSARRAPSLEPAGATRAMMAARHQAYGALSPGSSTSSFDELWAGMQLSLLQGLTGDPSALQLDWRSTELLQLALDGLAPRVSAPIDELHDGNPALVGLRDAEEGNAGRACVLFGAVYRQRPDTRREVAESARVIGGLLGGKASEAVDEALGFMDREDLRRVTDRFLPGKYEIETLVLFDPSLDDDPETPESERVVTLSYAEFERRCSLVVTRYDAHQVLRSWERTVAHETARR